MLSAERFQALMDELAAASPAEREAILNLPKSAPRLTIAEASDLTGYPQATLLDYARPSRQARMRLPIPPPAADRTWAAGDLALWAAGIPRDSEPAGPRRAGQPPADYKRLIPEARAALAAADGAVTNEQALRQALAGRGIRVGIHVARRLWLEVRPQQEVPDYGPLPASLRPDGLLTATQLARWARVTKSAIRRQVDRGRLTPARWDTEEWELRHGRIVHGRSRTGEVPLFDPDRVAHPGPGRRTPVDKISDEGNET